MQRTKIQTIALVLLAVLLIGVSIYLVWEDLTREETQWERLFSNRSPKYWSRRLTALFLKLLPSGFGVAILLAWRSDLRQREDTR